MPRGREEGWGFWNPPLCIPQQSRKSHLQPHPTEGMERGLAQVWAASGSMCSCAKFLSMLSFFNLSFFFLLCPWACRILDPGPEIEPYLFAVEAQS